jgi:plasmid stabilization system protein ParE
MSYGLIIRTEAELDIEDAFEWYEAQSPGLGSEFVRAVDVCFSGIGATLSLIQSFTSECDEH